MNELDTRALFTQYVHIVNQVLGSNRERPIFRPIIEGAETLLADRRLGIAVYDDDPSSPHHWFTASVEGGTFQILEHGKEDVDLTFRVPREHLEEVVEDRSEYLARPYKLDLDWLKSRLETLVS